MENKVLFKEKNCFAQSFTHKTHKCSYMRRGVLRRKKVAYTFSLLLSKALLS